MSSLELENSVIAEKNLDFLINDPVLTQAETISTIQSVMRFKPASVWVKPCYVRPVAALLRNKDIQIGTFIGCPDGSNNTQIKVAEAKRALTEGATLLAAPINVGFVKEQRNDALLADLHAVSGIAHMNAATFEVVFDPGFLDTGEIIRAAQIGQQADADIISFFIEFTNTGWDFSVFDLIQDKLGKSVQLKGLIRLAKAVDLHQFINKRLDRIGIRNPHLLK